MSTSSLRNLTTNPSKAPTSVNVPPTPRTNERFKAVVFARQDTENGFEQQKDVADDTNGRRKTQPLSTLNPLLNVVHQVGADGAPRSPQITKGLTKSKLSHPRRSSRDDNASADENRQGSLRSLLSNFWTALGVNDQQTEQPAPVKRATPLKPQIAQRKHSRKASSSSPGMIDLRPSVLPPLSAADMGKKCLVLDLDETLVHSSFKPIPRPDFVIPVEIEGNIYRVYVLMRPGADKFLIEMAKYYEIVIYTASLSKYADPLLDQLDPTGVIKHRLFREHCVQYEGTYVKDLSLLDRNLASTIIIDNSPLAYMFHPRNAIGCSNFIDDIRDRELNSIERFLVDIRDTSDVRKHLHLWSCNY